MAVSLVLREVSQTDGAAASGFVYDRDGGSTSLFSISMRWIARAVLSLPVPADVFTMISTPRSGCQAAPAGVAKKTHPKIAVLRETAFGPTVARDYYF